MSETIATDSTRRALGVALMVAFVCAVLVSAVAVGLRPLGAVTTLGGLVIFLASAPFVAPSGRIGTAWDVVVYGSYDDTFVRPLGEI